MSETIVYEIPEGNWATLCERLDKMTRRAKKLGRSAPILNIKGERSEVLDPKLGISQKVFSVTITSEPIAVGGWAFAASEVLIQPFMNLKLRNLLNGFGLPPIVIGTIIFIIFMWLVLK